MSGASAPSPFHRREDSIDVSELGEGSPCQDAQTASYRITGQPDMAVLWLDTHAVSNIAKVLNPDREDEEAKTNRRILEQLTELRRAELIFSFESDQLYEIESSPTRVRRCLEVLALISQGARTSYHHVTREQERVAMEAHVRKQIVTPIDWESAFDGDPLRDHSVNGKYFVRARSEPDDEELGGRRVMYGTISDEWEHLRQSGSSGPFQARFAERLETERLGMFQAVSHRVGEYMQQWADGDPELIAATLGRHQLFLAPLRDWRELGGTDLNDMLDFYRCSHHSELPVIDIWSHLAAWRIVGSEPISPSDIMDIHHISAFMPYCTHMVLDKSMINALQTLGLDKKYGTRVMGLREVPALLDSIV